MKQNKNPTFFLLLLLSRKVRNQDSKGRGVPVIRSCNCLQDLPPPKVATAELPCLWQDRIINTSSKTSLKDVSNNSEKEAVHK